MNSVSATAVEAPTRIIPDHDGMRRFMLAVILVETPFQLDSNFYYQTDLAAMGAITGINFSLTTICLAVLYATSFPRLVISAPGNDRPLWKPALPLVAYLGVLSISILVASNKTLAFSEIFLLLQTLLLFVYVVYWIRTREDVLFVVSMLLLGLFLQSAVMLAVPMMGHDLTLGPLTSRIDRNDRLEGTRGSPINAASYLALLLTPAVGVLLTPSPRRYQWLACAALGLGTAALVLTMSRGGWLAFGLSCGVLCYCAWRRGWISPAVPAILAILFAVSAILFQDAILSRLTGDDEGSAYARIPLARLALQMISDRPWIGVGANNCAVAAESYTGALFLRSEWIYTVHNKYLLVWIETGVLGLAAFMWFLGATLRRGWQAWKSEDRILAPLGLAFAAALLGHMAHMMFDVFHSRPQVQSLWLVAGVITAICHVGIERRS